MDRGRKICDVLKAVRKKIADMNDIAYEPRVCHFKGHCSGSCPACEAERKYIESELSLRKRMGEAVCVTGVCHPHMPQSFRSTENGFFGSVRV